MGAKKLERRYGDAGTVQGTGDSLVPVLLTLLGGETRGKKAKPTVITSSYKGWVTLSLEGFDLDTDTVRLARSLAVSAGGELDVQKDRKGQQILLKLPEKEIENKYFDGSGVMLVPSNLSDDSQIATMGMGNSVAPVKEDDNEPDQDVDIFIDEEEKDGDGILIEDDEDDNLELMLGEASVSDSVVPLAPGESIADAVERLATGSHPVVEADSDTSVDDMLDELGELFNEKDPVSEGLLEAAGEMDAFAAARTKNRELDDELTQSASDDVVKAMDGDKGKKKKARGGKKAAADSDKKKAGDKKKPKAKKKKKKK
jgi:hypothetical protein